LPVLTTQKSATEQRRAHRVCRHIAPLTLQEFLHSNFRGQARADDLIKQITALDSDAVSATPAWPPRGAAAKRKGSTATKTTYERDRRRRLLCLSESTCRRWARPQGLEPRGPIRQTERTKTATRARVRD